MKKIFFTFFVFILSINNVSAGSCNIKDKTSPALLEYVNSNREVIRAISAQLIESYEQRENEEKSLSKEAENEYIKVKSSALKIYNEIFNFDSYYSYFTYFASFPISNEVPHEVKRDYRVIEAEGKGIKTYIDNILKNNQGEVIIKNVCKNIKTRCDFPDDIEAGELIGKLTANNEAVLDLFRNTVIGESVKNKVKIQLVNENFELEIQTNYNIESYSKCSEEGGFFERIKNSIKEISILNQEGKDGIQKWKDAIDLMLGNDTKNEKYSQAEKRLLQNELSKQGVSGDNQTNMLNTLDKYNSEGFSRDNNFIKNTFNSTRIKLENKLKEFKDDVIGDFFEKKTGENININETITAQKNSTDTNVIKENIDSMYLELLNFEGNSELNTVNLRSKLINVHIDISNSINTLTKTCPKAVEICKQQDSGKGNCGECN